MATSNQDGGIFRRIRSHANSPSQKSKWSHFSLFAVWENIRKDEIGELESIFRGISQKEDRANSLNKQRGNKEIKAIRKAWKKWQTSEKV
jgi:hypothetical protein